MKDNQKEFIKICGQSIQNLRVSKGYSRDYLAEKIEISSKYLYEIEKGRKGCSSYILFEIAKALDVKIEYLLINSSH